MSSGPDIPQCHLRCHVGGRAQTNLGPCIGRREDKPLDDVGRGYRTRAHPGSAGAGRRDRRRDAGDGALFQRVSDGRWVGGSKVSQGGYRYFTGTTQKAVNERLKRAMRATEGGRPLPSERLTFGARPGVGRG